MSLQLKSGFAFDYDNLYGEGKVTEADLKSYEEDLKKAHEAMKVMREKGFIRAHLSKDGEPEKVLFSQLPYVQEGNLNSPTSLKRLGELTAHVKDNVDVVVSLGIGGSYLGNKVLFDVHCGEFWNELPKEERKGFPKVVFSGQNIDPRRTGDIIHYLENSAKVTKSHEKRNLKVLLLVISKSGGTLDTMSNFMVIYDIEQFLAGAKAMDEACQNDDIWQNPAMLNAALKFAAAEKHGRDIEVMMPYGDYLKSVSEWYIQLLAESLGKQFNKDGKEVCYGRTPLVAVGTTDMHSQTQQHQEGKLNKVVQFIRLKDWDNDLTIPDVFPEAKKLSDISGVTMGQALEVARQSNEDALASNKRYSACFTLPKLNAYHLGELLYMLAMSVAYEGELSNVDAFNQPGVEAYKRIMGPKLAEVKAANQKK